MIRITGMDTPEGRAAEAEYMRTHRWISCSFTPGCDGIGPVWQACQCGAVLLPPDSDRAAGT